MSLASVDIAQRENLSESSRECVEYFEPGARGPSAVKLMAVD